MTKRIQIREMDTDTTKYAQSVKKKQSVTDKEDIRYTVKNYTDAAKEETR